MFTKAAVKKMKLALLPANKTLYMGMLEGTPDEWGDSVREISYPAYKRLPLVYDGVIDHHPTGNTNTGTFEVMDKGLNGVGVAYYGLFDAEVGGELLEFGQFVENGVPTVEPISPNRTITIAVNAVMFGTIRNKSLSVNGQSECCH